jgi:hypothetical protein
MPDKRQKKDSGFGDHRRHFFQSPLMMRMYQQEVRLRASLEAIRDAHIKQLEAMELQRDFIVRAAQDGVNGHDKLPMVEGYLTGLGLDFDTDKIGHTQGKIYLLMGVYDRWFLEKIESLKSDFDEAIREFAEQANVEED